MPDELIPTILAHECGHIACHHTLYRTMGSMILQGMGRFITGLASLLTIPIEVAFAYWMRCSEFSADRAAVLCDGTPDKMAEVCFRLAGNQKTVTAHTSMDAFLRQAQEYRGMIADDKWNQTLEFMLLSGRDHPLTAVRALECREWAATEQYARVVSLLAYRQPDSLVSACDIPAPESSRGCVRKDMAAVKQMFEETGFRNLCFQRTMEKGPALQSGQIVSALIDGARPFDKGEWLPSDVPLVFVYYQAPTVYELAAAHPNQILLPEDPIHYAGRDHQQTVQAFLAMGFTNVSEEAVTVKRSWLIREGSVARVTVDNNGQFRKGQWVPADAPVCIYYNRFEEQPAPKPTEMLNLRALPNDARDAMNTLVNGLLRPRQPGSAPEQPASQQTTEITYETPEDKNPQT